MKKIKVGTRYWFSHRGADIGLIGNFYISKIDKKYVYLFPRHNSHLFKCELDGSKFFKITWDDFFKYAIPA